MIKELFKIPNSLWATVSFEEVSATYADMKELGIAQLPYPDMTIEAAAALVFPIVGPDGKASREVNWSLEDKAHIHFVNGLYSRTSIPARSSNQRAIEDVGAFLKKLPETESLKLALASFPMFAEAVEKLLVVLLATKNIVKERIFHPLARHGVGKEKALNTTTLYIGSVTERGTGKDGESSSDEDSPAVFRRPHLRRGHIRRQHHGQGNTLVKEIFIQPCFVNADESFISERTAYNVRKA